MHAAHLTLIRQHTGFRYPTGQDKWELETWLRALRAQNALTDDALRECALAHLRMLGIALPAEQELQRIVRTALHGLLHDLYERVTAQLSETTRVNLD